MPGPKNQELGIRSPLRLRGGIDFPNWEGINRQNDPGAIRNTQLFTGINCRSNGNEIVNRGGMSKVSETQLEGCVYGFIDVPEGATSLLMTPGAQLDRYYSEDTPLVNTIEPATAALQTIIYGDKDTPRRALVQFNGGAYQFGLDNSDTPVGTLFKIILPERTSPNFAVNQEATVLAQIKIEPVAQFPEFGSAVVRDQRVSPSILTPTMYIGSVSTGKVYVWDGISVSTEDTTLDDDLHIMANYQEDVYAICNDDMQKRDGGAWTTNIPLTSTGFIPCAATEYLTKLYIVGKAAMPATPEAAFTWDGSTIVNISGAINAALGAATPVGALNTIIDVKAFNGSVYFLILSNESTPVIYIVKYDGSTYSVVSGKNVSETITTSNAGALEPSGDVLWFSFKNGDIQDILGYVDTDDAITLLTHVDGQIMAYDIMAF